MEGNQHQSCTANPPHVMYQALSASANIAFQFYNLGWVAKVTKKFCCAVGVEAFHGGPVRNAKMTGWNIGYWSFGTSNDWEIN